MSNREGMFQGQKGAEASYVARRSGTAGGGAGGAGSGGGGGVLPSFLFRGMTGFYGGLTLGCAITFLLLFLLFNSPLAPLLDLYPPPSHERSHENFGSIFPASVWSLMPRAYRTRALVAAVRRRAPEDIRERCVAIIEGRPGSLTQSFAQAGQDWLLFHNYFFQIPYGKGLYLDIGSNHPLELSNTYFFDKCLGWRGVCIEPNPEYHPLYAKFNRTCKLVKSCLSDREGTATMDLKKGQFGSLGQAGPEVTCDLLSRVVADTRTAFADLASIDVEGFEYTALRCFPFRAYKISTWLVETDKARLDLFRLFIRSGYAYVGDILCPLKSLHSDRTRVGVKLDSVFRFVEPSFLYGPSFLPGRAQYGNGPQAACRAWSSGDAACPDQVPVIEVEEVHVENMTLRDGICELPETLATNPRFTLPTSKQPSIFKA